MMASRMELFRRATCDNDRGVEVERKGTLRGRDAAHCRIVIVTHRGVVVGDETQIQCHVLVKVDGFRLGVYRVGVT